MGNLLFFISVVISTSVVCGLIFKNNVKSFLAEIDADMVKIVSETCSVRSISTVRGERVENALLLEPLFHKEFYTMHNPREPFNKVDELTSSYGLILPLECFDAPQKAEEMVRNSDVSTASVNFFVKEVRGDDVVKIVLTPKNIYLDEINGYLNYATYKKLNPQGSLKVTFSHVLFAVKTKISPRITAK